MKILVDLDFDFLMILRAWAGTLDNVDIINASDVMDKEDYSIIRDTVTNGLRYDYTKLTSMMKIYECDVCILHYIDKSTQFVSIFNIDAKDTDFIPVDPKHTKYYCGTSVDEYRVVECEYYRYNDTIGEELDFLYRLGDAYGIQSRTSTKLNRIPEYYDKKENSIVSKVLDKFIHALVK